VKIIRSGATPSSIVQLARFFDRRAAAEGREYLRLGRKIKVFVPHPKFERFFSAILASG
jgi:hypothetical protein